MQAVMTGLTQRQEIALLITASLRTEDEVMDFQARIFRLPFTMLTGVLNAVPVILFYSGPILKNVLPFRKA